MYSFYLVLISRAKVIAKSFLTKLFLIILNKNIKYSKYLITEIPIKIQTSNFKHLTSYNTIQKLYYQKSIFR